MALYAIGDLHLSLAADKPMDVFGGGWENYTQKIQDGFSGLSSEDVCVICGDLSWASGLESAREDFLFINSLPGQKIILKGNHDYWWSTAAKAYHFFEENDISTIRVLHNNCYFYGDTALCGTRGWFYEEETGKSHDRKIMLREIGRLETSLKAAGDREKIVFLHYPPIFGSYTCPEILALFRQYRVTLCCYGHIHGRSRRKAFEGIYENTRYMLVSADHVSFYPQKIKESIQN